MPERLSASKGRVAAACREVDRPVVQPELESSGVSSDRVPSCVAGISLAICALLTIDNSLVTRRINAALEL